MPPPMSHQANAEVPFVSGNCHARGGERCCRIRVGHVRPQRRTHLTMFCAADTAPVNDVCTFTSSSTPDMPTGSRTSSLPVEPIGKCIGSVRAGDRRARQKRMCGKSICGGCGRVLTSEKADIKPGNRLPLEKNFVGTFIYNGNFADVRRQNDKKRRQFRRAFGSRQRVTFLKMPSTEIKVSLEAWASIGQGVNEEYKLRNFGKAGRSRWLRDQADSQRQRHKIRGPSARRWGKEDSPEA